MSATKPTVFPMTGDYHNDCPFCRTHNAILATCRRDPAEERNFIYECRDCHREFTSQHEAQTYTYLGTVNLTGRL